MARKKESIEKNVWFTIDRSNIEAVRKALPEIKSGRSKMPHSTDEDPVQMDPFHEANGQVIGVAECRIVDHPRRGRVAFIMYGDGVACMLHDGVITWSYEQRRPNGTWLFECEEKRKGKRKAILGYDEDGNEVSE